MTSDETRSPVCARVLDRLVETGDVSGDSELENHLGSCMACYRTLTELRDAPRLAALMREGAPAQRRDEAFWTDAADRTTDAVATALRGVSPPKRFLSRAVTATVLVAAAAVIAIVVGRSRTASFTGTAAAPAAGEFARLPADEDVGDGEEVADLDTTTLRRLVERLRARAPQELAALAAADSSDGAEALLDDDARVSDELADLDQAALVRIERSLAGSAL